MAVLTRKDVCWQIEIRAVMRRTRIAMEAEYLIYEGEFGADPENARYKYTNKIQNLC